MSFSMWRQGTFPRVGVGGHLAPKLLLESERVLLVTLCVQFAHPWSWHVLMLQPSLLRIELLV